MTSDVLLGAGIAFAGVVLKEITSFVKKHLATSKGKRTFYRKKCEYLAQCMTECSAWTLQLSLCHTYEDVRQCHFPKEASIAVALTSLYFPSLADAAAIYSNSLLAYYSWLLTLQSPHTTHILTVIELAEGNSEYIPLQGKIAQSRNDFQQALSKQVQQYL
jgi:hypothetical protein